MASSELLITSNRKYIKCYFKRNFEVHAPYHWEFSLSLNYHGNWHFLFCELTLHDFCLFFTCVIYLLYFWFIGVCNSVSITNIFCQLDIYKMQISNMWFVCTHVYEVVGGLKRSFCLPCYVTIAMILNVRNSLHKYKCSYPHDESHFKFYCPSKILY